MDGEGPGTVPTALRFVPERCMVTSNLGTVGCESAEYRAKQRNQDLVHLVRFFPYKIEAEPPGMGWAGQTPRKLTIRWPPEYKVDHDGFVSLFSYGGLNDDGTPVLVNSSLRKALEEVPSEYSLSFALDVTAGTARAELEPHYRPLRRGDSFLSSLQPFTHPDLGPELSGDEADSLSDAREESEDQVSSELSDEGRRVVQAPLRRPLPNVVGLEAKQAKDAIESQGYAMEVEVGSPARRETDSYRVSRQQPRG